MGWRDWAKKERKKLMDRDHSVVTARGNGEWWGAEEGVGQINSDGQKLDLGW